MEAGRLLLEARELVGQATPGGWRAWLEANCEVSETLAQKYMRVARALPELLAGPNPPRVADLSFRQALEVVATNAELVQEVPEPHQAEAADAAIDSVERNDPINTRWVVGAVIHKYSPQELPPVRRGQEHGPARSEGGPGAEETREWDEPVSQPEEYLLEKERRPFSEAAHAGLADATRESEAWWLRLAAEVRDRYPSWTGGRGVRPPAVAEAVFAVAAAIWEARRQLEWSWEADHERGGGRNPYHRPGPGDGGP
jgi:hypothetical protein